MTIAFVGLGSNLHRPERQLDMAVASMAAIPDTRLIAVSSYYLSAPLGPRWQPDFVNAAAKLRTRLAARRFLGHLHDIERAQGRVRGRRWGPRTIDLDLLLFGDMVSERKSLHLPHPGIAERNFVLLPLREIAPDLEISGIGRVADIAVDESDPRIIQLR